MSLVMWKGQIRRSKHLFDTGHSFCLEYSQKTKNWFVTFKIK